MVEQPFDGALAGVNQAVVHLLCLLGDVDVHGQAGAVRIGRQFLQRRWTDRAQRVDGHTHVDARVARRVALHVFDDANDAVGCGGKAALVVAQAALRKPGTHVQRGQQRQAHAGALGRAHQRQRHLGRFGIGRAGNGVVQVMELADLGVAAAEQFGIQLAGNGFQLLGRDAVGGRVHAVAPAPEVVSDRCARAAPLGQADDGALEGMAVGVDHARQHRTNETRGGGLLLRRGVGRDLAPAAVGRNAQQHVLGPGTGHPGLRCEELLCFTFHSDSGLFLEG